MAKVLGLLIGMLTIIDGALGMLSPNHWREFWRDVCSVLPGKSKDYIDEVIDVTEKYRVTSPSSVATFFVAEMAFGLLMLKLAKKSKW